MNEPAATAPETTAAAVATPVETVEPFAADEPLAQTAPDASGDNTLLVGALAGGAALLLAIWGFVAIGRRRGPARRGSVPVVERPVVERPVAFVEPAPLMAEPTMAPPRTEWDPRPAPAMAHTGASVSLPRALPATFAERDELIRRMVAAKPDRANPFTAPLQRRKRAKLILQSLGRDFGEQEPWIDLSHYPQNWPELHRRHAAA